MIPRMTLDVREVQRQLSLRVAATGQVASVVVRQQARLFVRDVARFTPPTGNAPVTESFGVQRGFGRRAVESDITGLFKPVGDLEFIKNPRNARVGALGKGYAERREFGKLKELMRRVGVKGELVTEANRWLHSKHRGYGGRTLRGRRLYVMHAPSIGVLVREKKQLVGLAKSGWAKAARSVGQALPAWIVNHAGPGYVIDDLRHPTFPSITMANTVDYIQSAGARLRVVQRALDRRAESMRNQLRAMMNQPFLGYGKAGRRNAVISG